QVIGLEQDRVRNRELADVVEQRRLADHLELRLREAEFTADPQRELLYAPRVARRVRVAGVDGRRQRLHRGRRALLEQAVRALERDVLRLDRLRRLPQLLRRALGVADVRLLRLAHQEEWQREDEQPPDPDRLVGLVDHA